jgi:Protein of unknown function (DUF3015)
MTRTLRQQLISMVGIIAIGVGLSACTTTTPQDLSQDGQVKQEQKINLFAGVAYENLRQEAATGGGQYVRSLAVLFGVPASEHERFAQLLQANHSTLFITDLNQDRTAHLKMVDALNRALMADASLTR